MPGIDHYGGGARAQASRTLLGRREPKGSIHLPFIEIWGFDQNDATRQRLSRDLTDALCRAFDIAPDIVTLYFQTLQPRDYAHAGVHSPEGSARTFIKVHAFARPVARKRAAARALCEAAAAALGVPAHDVILYFFDRPAHDVAHGGLLASDEPA